MGPFRDVVTTLDELRALLGEPSEVAQKKQVDRLDEHCREFIARSPFVLLATADAAGNCDVSPKGDPAGFVLVLDERHLVIPDRPGNRRFDGMRNILANPHVGLLFLVPGRGETLRINGRASIVRDAEVLARLAVEGKTPRLAIGVEVEEVFLHCAKALMRSHLWDAGRHLDRKDFPSMGQCLADQIGGGLDPRKVEEEVFEGYRKNLY
jgi:hypothetical protein